MFVLLMLRLVGAALDHDGPILFVIKMTVLLKKL